MKTNDTTPPAGTPKEVAALLPEQFNSHNSKMSTLQLQVAVLVAERNPELLKSAQEFKDSYNRAGQTYFGMCSALRASKIVKKEATAFLLAMGFSKSRASEVIRLSSVSDAIWSKYSAGSVGFKAALQLENQEDAPTQSSAGGTPAAVSTPSRKLHPLPKEVHQAFTEACALIVRPLKKGAKTEWTYACRTPEGVNFYVSLIATPKA